MDIRGPLKKQYRRLTSKIDGLSARERIIMFLMINTMLFVGVYALLIDPTYQHVRSLSKEIRKTKNELLVTEGDFKVVKIEYSIDPNEHMNRKIDKLVGKIRRSNSLLRSKTSELISSSSMADVLKELLLKQTAIRLVSLNNIKVVPVVWGESEQVKPKPARPEIPADKSMHELVMESIMSRMLNADDLKLKDPSAGEDIFLAKDILLYRHGVRMELETDYHSFVSYLMAIEAMDWNFLWHRVNYEVSEHPRANVELEIHTLGFEEGWLGV